MIALIRTDTYQTAAHRQSDSGKKPFKPPFVAKIAHRTGCGREKGLARRRGLKAGSN
jgi:hypothetical protein